MDGIVHGRSVFHHSVNYRSAVVPGRARTIPGEDAKRHGMQVLAEHVAPGSWDYARRPDARELAAVAVTALDLTESAVKVRTGPPRDRDDEVTPDMWAGVLPVASPTGQSRGRNRLQRFAAATKWAVCGWESRLRQAMRTLTGAASFKGR
ncbi:hypothetical protein JCM4914_66420 [Streptomyces platensis subsp. malvinus]